MIFLFGDQHGINGLRRYEEKNFKEGYSLTKDDLVIVLGDFGIPWYKIGSNEDEVNHLHKLSLKPWTTVFIDGNHENFDNLKSLPVEERWGGKVSKLEDSVYWLHRGQIFNFQGKKFFTFGGAYSIDKGNRRERISWWPEENPNREEIEEALTNLDKANYEVDFVLTHTCSNKTADSLLRFYNAHYYREKDLTSDFLDIVEQRIKCQYWFFGHWHVDWCANPTERPLKYCLYDNYVKLFWNETGIHGEFFHVQPRED